MAFLGINNYSPELTIDRIEAIKYFESIKDYTKAGVMKYNTNTYH